MYFWRLSTISHTLAHDRISQRISFLHCFFTMLYLGAGLIGSWLFPTLYRLGIEKINLFTQLYISHGRPMVFFTDYNSYINVVVYLFMVLGFWYCFYVNQHTDNHDFLKRFWTLSWPTLVRATVYTFLLALLCFGSFVAFYLIKLLFIGLMSIKTTPTWILKIYGKVESGGLSTSMQQLRLIKTLAKTMNNLSWYLYLSFCGCAIVQVLFFIRIMAKYLRLTAHIERETKG